MKTMKLLFTLLFVAGFAAVGFGQNIEGSAHDFSGETWSSNGEICIACHTPHNANDAVTQSPLWNHEVTTESFTVYSSNTLNADDVTPLGQPSAESLLCLSCHDGSVALDNYGGTTTGNAFIVDGDSTFVGIDLGDDHPISFDYDNALYIADGGAAGGLWDPGVQTTDLGGTITATMLFNNQVQCASCHDVHNAQGFDNLLRIDNAGSNLCLTCHNK